MLMNVGLNSFRLQSQLSRPDQTKKADTAVVKSVKREAMKPTSNMDNKMKNNNEVRVMKACAKYGRERKRRVDAQWLLND